MAKAYRVAPLLAFVAVLSAVAYMVGVFAPLDHFLAAKRFGIAEHPPTGSIAVVDIDARSLAAVGAWPWPRRIHAEIIDRLVAAGASAIALDIDFSTISTSVGDTALESALRDAGGAVILAAFRQPASNGTSEQIVNRPIARFADNAWIGMVNVWPDADGAVRNSYFGEMIDGVPTLSIAALLSGRPGALGSEFGIDFSIAANAIDRISAIDLIEGRVDPARIVGRSIVVSASAVELGDIFEVPVYGFVSGGLLQALAAETLIQDRAMATPTPAVIFAVLALLAVLAALLMGRFGWRPVVATLAAAAVTIELVAFLMQTNGNLIVPTGAWQFALLAFAGVGLAREVDVRGLAAAAFRRDSLNTRTVLNRVVEDSVAGVVVVDQRGTILAASDAVRRILRLPPDLELVGRKQSEILPVSISEALTAVSLANPAPAEVSEIHVSVGDVEDVILEVTAKASALDHGGERRGAEPEMVGCVTFVDVTEKRRLEARTAQLAWYDGLTGLPNRNYFSEALRAAIREVAERGEGKSALLFFDIDRFKNVNDTLGHHFGDLLLAAVAKRAQEALDESGLLVRLGGDEFAVLAPGLNQGEIAVLAKQIIAALSAPFMLEGYRVAIGASAGISLIEPGNDDPATVMKQADLALHAAKSDGSGHRFFDPDMDDNLDQRRQIEVALWDALQGSQLEIEYQPQVDIETGRIIGVEALSRWMHPQFGEVPPDRFVPIAEATGLIDQIGSAVLMRACRAVAPFRDLTLSVNVSPVQFARGDLIGAVSAALSASKLDPSRLELEVTESVFLGSGDHVRQKMKDLTDLGVRFALDDFGTGFSSLNNVREFPFHVIKIDRSFVSRLLFDPGSAAIVRAVLAMAEGLDKRVVAEGIESEEQRRILALMGCKEGQGFLFGKAVPVAELAALLSRSDERRQKLSA